MICPTCNGNRKLGALGFNHDRRACLPVVLDCQDCHQTGKVDDRHPQWKVIGIRLKDARIDRREKEIGFRATIFMVGINFDRANRLTSSQIREMAANSIEIGAHSMTHRDLTRLSRTDLRYEVVGSKQKVEQVVRAEAGYFAYPGGFYNLAALEAVESAGFQGAFSVLPGLNRPDRDNIYLLRRIPIFRFTNFDRLLAKMEIRQAKPSLLDY